MKVSKISSINILFKVFVFLSIIILYFFEFNGEKISYRIYKKINENFNNTNHLILNDSLYVDIKIPKESEFILDSFRSQAKMWEPYDVRKNWVKGKILSNGLFENCEIKFHGSDPVHFLKEKSSYTIKVKNDYYGMKIFKLIKSEEADAFVCAANKIAFDYGLITSYGKMVILRINGKEFGDYCLVESIKKQFLKNNFNIKKYSILENTNDWSRKEGFGHHESPFDFFSGHIKKKNNKYFPFALGQFRKLSKWINEDRDILIFFDREYIVKFLAFLSIFNEAHHVKGDNLKLLFNVENNKFYPIFRIETLGREISLSSNKSSVIKFKDFDNFVFESQPDFSDESQTFKIFKLLLSNKEIFNNRNKLLYEISRQKSEFINSLNKKIKTDQEVSTHANGSKIKFHENAKRQKQIVNNTLNLFNDYINYAHIYSSYDKNNNTLEIISDAFSPINFHYSYLSAKIDKLNFNGILLNDDLTFKYDTLKINFKNVAFNIDSVLFTNSITNKIIPKNKIYINTYF